MPNACMFCTCTLMEVVELKINCKPMGRDSEADAGLEPPAGMDILWTCAPALHEACLTDRPLPQALPSLGVLQIWSTGLSGSLPQTWFQPGAWQKLRFVQVLNNSGISGVVAWQLYFRGCAVMDLRLWVRKTCPAQPASSRLFPASAIASIACLLSHIAGGLQRSVYTTLAMLSSTSYTTSLPALQSALKASHLAGTLPDLPRGALPSLGSLEIQGASLQGTLPQLFGSGSIEFVDLISLGLSGYASTIQCQSALNMLPGSQAPWPMADGGGEWGLAPSSGAATGVMCSHVENAKLCTMSHPERR